MSKIKTGDFVLVKSIGKIGKVINDGGNCFVPLIEVEDDILVGDLMNLELWSTKIKYNGK